MTGRTAGSTYGLGVAVDGGRRAALDGLRAVAVTAVVAYHLGGGAAGAVRGGFLGVDLFFVLSGYLITGLLVREHRDRSRIDLVGFWERRVRRLLPALLLVLVVVALATWWAARPETWSARRGDALWTLAYLANWHFVAAGEDYFAAYAGASPLRHTWSLSIEEQFYLLWPLVVVGCLRVRRELLAVVAGVLVVASAAAMAWAYGAASLSRAYYGTDGRVQQLLVGALLALLLARARRLPRYAGPAAFAALLLALVLASDAAPVYYRGGALAFAALTAVVVADVELRPDGGLARALSWAPAAALGRISYGVYLWHWPVLVLTPLPSGPSPAWWLTQALRVGLTLGLSVLSWVLVERPVLERRVPWVGGSRRRLAVGALGSVALVVVAVLLATRLPSGLQRQLDDRADTPCPGESATLLVACVQGGSNGAVTMVLGDSTARALVPGLADQAGRDGTRLVQAAWQRCSATGLLVVPNGMSAPDAPARVCSAQARPAITAALARYRPAVVVVSEFWAHHQVLLVGGRRLAPGTPDHDRALRTAYLGLVDEAAAAGARVVFVDVAPPGRSLGPVVAAGRPAGAVALPFSGRYVAGFDDLLAAVAAARPGRAATVSITDLLCPGGRCDAVQHGKVVRVDGVHVTAAFSRVLAPVLLARVERALAG